MSDLSDLYQEMILDHGRNPRNFYACEHADLTEKGFNPLCGDEVTLYIQWDQQSDQQPLGADLNSDLNADLNSSVNSSVNSGLRAEKTVIKKITFQGAGCAISMASASLLTQVLQGKTREEVSAWTRDFQKLVKGEATSDEPKKLGKLAVLAGVSAFPGRVKCAMLAWHTLRAALDRA